MRMSIPEGQEGGAAQIKGKANSGSERAVEASGRFKADESLVSVDELNVGVAGAAGSAEMVEADFGREPGEPGTTFDATHGGHVVNKPPAPGISPNTASAISGPVPGAPDDDPQPAAEKTADTYIAKAPIAGRVTDQHETEKTAMSIRDSIVDLAVVDAFSQPSGADAKSPPTSKNDTWMDIVENHPELSYHQAEVLLQVALMTPDSMGQAIKQCVYLLGRMERLGPSVLDKSVAVGRG